jgi:hypothetical protein
MFLETRAAAFGLEDLLVLRASSFVDEFEGDAFACEGVLGQIHATHAAGRQQF